MEKQPFLRLREGVKFHNGKELDASVLSPPWSAGASSAPAVPCSSAIWKVEATGKYEVTLTFKAPFAPWKNLLAFMNGGPVIYPKDVASGAEKAPITPEQYIGTGPYKFAERNRGRYIKLVRNEEYSAKDRGRRRLCRQAETLFDEIRFIPVPDVGTRVNGVKAGDYDYASRSWATSSTPEENPSVVTTVPWGANQGMMFFNSRAGVLKDNSKLRQALQAAVNMEPVLQSAIGPAELWKASGSFMPESTLWYSKAGLDRFSANNPELAKKLAKEAGYNGEKITLMASTSYKFHYDSTLVIVKQLQAAGFSITTTRSTTGRPSSPSAATQAQWDIFFTHHGFVPDPILYTFMSESYPGWWTTEIEGPLPPNSPVPWTRQSARQYGTGSRHLSEEVPVMKTGDRYLRHLQPEGSGTPPLHPSSDPSPGAFRLEVA